MIPSHLQGRTLEQLRETQETIRCFLVEPDKHGYLSITVFEDAPPDKPCIKGFDYHRSEKILERFELDANGKYPDSRWPAEEDKRLHAPKYCFRCGNYEFSDKANLSWGKGRSWRNVDSGEVADNLNAFGPGAMWYLSWYELTRIRCTACNSLKQSDADASWRFNGEGWEHKCPDAHPQAGHFSAIEEQIGFSHPGFEKVFDYPALCIRTPGGEWVVDSRCSNCGNPTDQEHKCWPRQGEPPLVTVDKSFGSTCVAGGGSIITGERGPNPYHGFLRNGFLIKC